MASNQYSPQDNRSGKDQEIRRKMTGLEDTSYDREGGWEKLSGKLLKKAFSELNTATREQGAAPAKSNRPALLFPAWKMAAAAILLLTVGFLTGRLSYFSARQDRQNITQITAKALAAPTSVVPDSISPMVKTTADAAGRNAIVSSRAGRSAKSAAAVNNTGSLTITQKRASGPAAAAPATKATAMRKEKRAALPTDQTAPKTTATGLAVKEPESGYALGKPAAQVGIKDEEKLNNADKPGTATAFNNYYDTQKKQPQPKPKPLPVISIADVNMNTAIIEAAAKDPAASPLQKSRKNMYQVISKHQGASGSFPISIRL